jgi:hypothetical protein
MKRYWIHRTAMPKTTADGKDNEFTVVGIQRSNLYTNYFTI